MPTVANKLPAQWAVPKMLTWAREQVGLSVLEAAQRVNTSLDLIKAWESGLRKPSLADLENLADIYDCPAGYFFLDQPPSQEKLPLDFRGVMPEKVDSLSYQTRLALRNFLRLMQYASDLIQATHTTWSIQIGTVDFRQAPEQAAQSERTRLGMCSDVKSTWSSSTEAYDWWHSAIEKQGVFILALKLDPHEIRGTSVWHQGSIPGILVNREDSEAAAGRTFTLLHEYAHLLLRQSGIVCDFRGGGSVERIESYANRFAAETMVPREEFLEVLKAKGLDSYRERWNDEILRELRKPFGASKDTIAILLESLKFAPQGFYRGKRQSWDRQRPGGSGSGSGPHLTKVQQRRRDMGVHLSSLLALAHDKDLISEMELAELLDLKIERTREFVELAKRTQS